ncbi:unnamed protein product [Cylindrotheca closterium]|uniref:Uncharacterized protein n=1 Tax=Cylindrotheca closterium TaxID=2856 RepID=A0AAD2G6A4_9STRA|nr:unnamed protein product [Cylindrotheca closterium]
MQGFIEVSTPVGNVYLQTVLVNSFNSVYVHIPGDCQTTQIFLPSPDCQHGFLGLGHNVGRPINISQILQNSHNAQWFSHSIVFVPLLFQQILLFLLQYHDCER